MSIYLQHFALAREPFSIVPDPGFLYPSVYHRQAVAHLKYGLDREGGFILLTGEVGTGKTTLTRTMIKRIPPHVRVAYILNSKLNASDVLASICDELDIKLPSDQELSFTKQCIDALNKDLLAAHAEGKKTLIVLEEAQNLTPEVLETLRLLSNLETSTHKLLHILLVGQPELLGILAQTELRQLNQRVVSRFHLSPLDKNDLSNYINHRLHRAGAKRPIFDPACIPVLFRLTGGVPRLINLVCHQSLVAAYSIGSATVSAKLVKQAAKEILSDEKKSPGKSWLLGMVAALVLIAVVTLINPPALLTQALHSSPLAVSAPVEQTNETDTLSMTGSIAAVPVVTEAVEEASVQAEQTKHIAAELMLTEKQMSVGIGNPFINLLARWGAEASEVYSEEEFAAVASEYSLRAEKITLAGLKVLEQINRPGIVWLRNIGGDHQGAYLQSAVLARLDSDSAELLSREGTAQISRDAFQQAWNGSFLYLWRPPEGFSEPLSASAAITSNPEVVDWLQAQLAVIDNNSEVIISGGHYTEAIALQVLRFQRQQKLVADGILGRETLLRLNQLSESDIPRLSEDF